MAAVQEIVDEATGSGTVRALTQSAIRATEGAKKVKEVQGTHRRRLAYRNRNWVKKNADEKIELRKAEKQFADFNEFMVEDVNLKSWKAEDLEPWRAAFNAFDLDHDEIITIDEAVRHITTLSADKRPKSLAHINPFMRKKLKDAIIKIDTDGDGSLSYDESSSGGSPARASKPRSSLPHLQSTVVSSGESLKRPGTMARSATATSKIIS